MYCPAWQMLGLLLIVLCSGLSAIVIKTVLLLLLQLQLTERTRMLCYMRWWPAAGAEQRPRKHTDRSQLVQHAQARIARGSGRTTLPYPIPPITHGIGLRVGRRMLLPYSERVIGV